MTDEVQANHSDGAGNPTSLLNALERLRGALEHVEQETLADLQAIWSATHEIVERQQYAAEEAESLVDTTSPLEFAVTRRQLADKLLRQPINDLARLNPIAAIQNTFAGYRAALKDLEREQPVTVQSSGPDVLANIDTLSAGGGGTHALDRGLQKVSARRAVPCGR